MRSRQRGAGTDWVLRATGRVRSWQVPEFPIDLWTPKIEPPPQVGRARFYRDLAKEGHTFGPAFQGVETIWYAEGCALGKIVVPIVSTLFANETGCASMTSGCRRGWRRGWGRSPSSRQPRIAG